MVDEYTDFDAWMERLLDEADEFSYRYIYDAYLLAIRPKPGREIYLEMSRLEMPGGETGYRIEEADKPFALLLPSDQARLNFCEYLIQRFCPQTRDMRAWHDQRHQWYVDDLEDWV